MGNIKKGPTYKWPTLDGQHFKFAKFLLLLKAVE
jgi:hypothetical protein